MRLVGADEAKKYLYEHLDDLNMIAAQNAIDEMPTIDAQPVKRGKWKCVNDDENVWMCTNCGNEISLEVGNPAEFEWLFCLYCGANMGGKRKE
ncbi:MAG: hypothetical protein IJH64_00875 [Oscillospiraceae bacterium]|nr:hypothetical protein [Oscillospiraceae bacterium]